MKKIILLLLLSTNLLISGQNTAHGKLILLYVEMKNCPWCIKMDREVFDNESNLNELEKNYHVQRLRKCDGFVPDDIEIKYYPTTIILSSDGSVVVDELPGYMKAKDYMEYLQILHEFESE